MGGLRGFDCVLDTLNPLRDPMPRDSRMPKGWVVRPQVAWLGMPGHAGWDIPV
jgi:hypothetical protein